MGRTHGGLGGEMRGESGLRKLLLVCVGGMCVLSDADPMELVGAALSGKNSLDNTMDALGNEFKTVFELFANNEPPSSGARRRSGVGATTPSAPLLLDIGPVPANPSTSTSTSTSPSTTTSNTDTNTDTSTGLNTQPRGKHRGIMFTVDGDMMAKDDPMLEAISPRATDGSLRGGSWLRKFYGMDDTSEVGGDDDADAPLYHSNASPDSGFPESELNQ